MELFSVGMEQGVLCTLLMSPSSYDKLAGTLSADDLYSERHRIIYTAIESLINNGQSPDPVLVHETIRQQGEAQEKASGGQNYLAKLLAEAVCSPAMIDQYGQRLRELATRRRGVEALVSGQGILNGRHDVNAESAINSVVDGLLASIPGRTGSDVMDMRAAFGLLHADLGRVGEPVGVSTGFVELDNKVGGLRAGQLVVIGGRPGSGKTTFATNVIAHIAQTSSKPCPVFSLEMPTLEMTQRLVAAYGSLPLGNIIGRKLVSDQQWSDFSRASQAVTQLPLFISDAPAQTLAQIRTTCNRLRRQHGELGAVLIDYLQIMGGHDPNNMVNTITETTKGLKALAKEFGCPVLLLSQLNRTVESRPNKRPLMADLRDSGSIEQDADTVWLLYREAFYDPECGHNLAELNVAKNRNGPVGPVTLKFEGQFSRFENAIGVQTDDD